MLVEKVRTGVAVTLIICAALLMSGRVSPVWGDPIVAPLELEKPTEFEFMESTQLSNGMTIWTGKRIADPETAVLIEPEYMEITKPGFMEPTLLSNGLTVRMGNRDNVAYLRCAKLKEFSSQQKCALEALGMTQEAVDQAVESYNK